MELLESQDPEKQKLIASSERHLRALEKEAKEITQNTNRALNNALLVGGALVLGYVVISQFTKSSGKKKKKKKDSDGESAKQDGNAQNEPSIFAQVGEQILSQATVILIEIARTKLEEYLQSRKNNEKNSEYTD